VGRVEEEEEDDDSDDAGEEADASEESGGCSDGADPQAPTWRERLAEVPFEEIDRLRREGARVQPLARRTGEGADKGRIKRLNKNRPVEATSKKPVSRFRLAYGYDAGALKAPEAKRIDPRFEAVSGSLDPSRVRQQYGFVYDQARHELEALRSSLKGHRKAEALTGRKRQRARRKGALLGEDEARALQSESDRRLALLSRHDKEDRERRAKAALRKKEAQAVAQGKRPYFPKKAVIKEAALKEQYEDLKRQGTLDKALNAKRKRKAKKANRRLGRAGADEE